MATNKAVLLVIADISGFTHFMSRHSMVSSHAREITVRLLKALIRASGPPLRLAEIEGDAVFLYASIPENEAQTAGAALKKHIVGMFRAFNAEVERLEAMDACACEACSTVGNLRLKQIAHFGEATIEKVDRFEKLFSLDVILVHRLVKNSVNEREYVLMTAPAYEVVGPFGAAEPERMVEEVDGIGDVETFVFRTVDLADEIVQESDESVRSTSIERLAWRLRLRWSDLRRRASRLLDAHSTVG